MVPPASSPPTAAVPAATILDEIVRRRLEPLSPRKRKDRCRRLREQAAERAGFEPRDFVGALRRSRPPVVIAELKRASPSRGRIREDFDVPALAAAYERAGAAALSVLTEPNYFEGSLDYLAQARAATRLPILRKDFIVHEYQIWESALAGADAVLLIAALLGEIKLSALLAAAGEAGLAALVEVHTDEELRRVRRLRRALCIGVNNRDLRDFSVDLGRGEALGAGLPADRVCIAESGLRAPADLARLSRAGYSGFLMGESFMQADNPGAALARLRAACRRPYVKICGLTNLADATHACEQGADAVGFVFAERSPRRVSPEVVKSIVPLLPSQVCRVGVFTGQPVAAVLAIARECGLHAVQLHGPYEPAAARGLRGTVAVWRALAMPREAQQAREWAPVAERFVLDTAAAGPHPGGGTGQTFDWAHADRLLRDLRRAAPAAPSAHASLVAGGLRAANVARALHESGAAGADVASGVERQPGVKNPRLVADFCRTAHRVLLLDDDAPAREARPA